MPSVIAEKAIVGPTIPGRRPRRLGSLVVSDRATRGLSEVGVRRASVDIGLQLVGRVANVALGLVVTVVLIRALGDTGFGQWSTILAVVQIVGYFGDLGLQQIAVRKAAEEPEREGVWIGALLSLRLVIAGPVFAVTVGVLLILSTNAEMRIGAAVLATTVLVSAVGSLNAIFQLRLRNSLSAAFELLNGVAWGACVLVIAALDGGLVPFAVAFSAVSGLVVLAQTLVARREVSVRLRGTVAAWPDLVRVGLPVAISGLLILSYGRIDQVLVFELDGERGAGLYGAAYRIVDRAQLVASTIMATLFPLIAAAHPAAPARVRAIVQAAIDLLVASALPAFAFTAAAATPMVAVLFGPDFAGSERALTILMGTFVLTSVGYLCGFVIIVLGLQKRFLRYAGAGLVVNVVLNVVLIGRYGYVAAAWVILLTQVLVIGLSLRAILGALGQRLQLGRLARIAFASLGMGLVVALAARASLPLGGLVVLGTVAYVGALTALGAVSRDELRLILRRGGS